MAFNFGGFMPSSGGRRVKMSQLLAQMPDPNNGTTLGGLGSVLQRALMGYQMGQEQQGMQDTLAKASQALESRSGAMDAPGPTMSGDAGYNITEKKPDMGKYAQILLSNPDTMDMGYRAQASNAEQEARRRMMEEQRQMQVQDMQTQRGWSQEDRAAQQAFQREMQQSQMSQAERMARLQAGLSAGNRPLEVVPDPANPGKFVYGRPQPGMAAIAPKGVGGAILGYTPDGAPIMGNAPKLSATQEKELFEADDIIRNSQFAGKALEDARKLNPEAAAGMTAPVVTAWQRNAPEFLGGNPQAAAKTSEYNSIVTGQALDNLRAIFGGNPTEGERKILMDIQAAPTMSVAEREALLARTQQAVMNRQTAAQTKAQSIRSGSFATQGGAMPPAPGGIPSGQGPQPGAVMDGYQFMGGNPADPRSWRRM